MKKIIFALAAIMELAGTQRGQEPLCYKDGATLLYI